MTRTKTRLSEFTGCAAMGTFGCGPVGGLAKFKFGSDGLKKKKKPKSKKIVEELCALLWETDISDEENDEDEAGEVESDSEDVDKASD